MQMKLASGFVRTIATLWLGANGYGVAASALPSITTQSQSTTQPAGLHSTCPSPRVIAHRGASGYAPEHSQTAYQLAVTQGADIIELDLVVSQDQQLLIRHENELSQSTDVAERPEFAPRKRRKWVDGMPVTGWFSEDFQLAELQTLKLRESKPAQRPANKAQNDRDRLWSLSQFLTWQQQQWQQGRRFDLYVELKHPTYFLHEAPDGFQADPAQLLLEALQRQPLPAGQALYIESFEATPLQRWHHWKHKIPNPVYLVQLIGDTSLNSVLPDDNFGYPWDWVYQAKQAQPQLDEQAYPRYAQMVTAEGLAQVARYADAIGPWRENLYAYAKAPLASWFQHAKQLGLKVHPYTYRLETDFLQQQPNGQHIPLVDELAWLFQQQVDGVFTDQPDVAIAVRQQCQTTQRINN